MLLLNNTFGESAGFGEVGMEGLTDEYSQAASGGIVLNYLFFLPLCLLGFVCSATCHDGPAALLICLAPRAVASSTWLMPGYYIISQGKASSSPLRLRSICLVVSAWRNGGTQSCLSRRLTSSGEQRYSIH